MPGALGALELNLSRISRHLPFGAHSRWRQVFFIIVDLNVNSDNQEGLTSVVNRKMTLHYFMARRTRSVYLRGMNSCSTVSTE